MEQKARMTFRFEPPKKAGPKPTERKPATETMKQHENVIDIMPREEQPTGASNVLTSWNAPFQDDIHALEEIIRRSEPVVPAPREEIRPITEISKERWSLSDGPEIETEAEHQSGWLSGSLSRREGPSWWRVFLSVSAAVATGALFGYLVLTLFTGEPLFPSRTGGAKDTTPPPSAEAAGGAMPTLEIPAQDNGVSSDPKGQPAVSEVPGDVYYLLQYGVFRNADSMQAAVQDLDGKGLASAVDTNEGYRIYAGVASSRNEAELLAAQMSGTEVYIKPLEGEPLTISKAEHPEGLADLMKLSGELSRLLTEFTVAGLQEKSPQALSADNAASLQNAHREWLQRIGAADALNGDAKVHGKALIQALNSAVMSMTEYNRKPSRYHLWSVQTAVMKALIADRDLRLSLKPSAKQ